MPMLCTGGNEGFPQVALGKPVTSSHSVQVNEFDPSRATDGRTDDGVWRGTEDGASCALADPDSNSAWFKVDMEQELSISRVEVVGRSDCCPEESEGWTIRVGNKGEPCIIAALRSCTLACACVWLVAACYRIDCVVLMQFLCCVQARRWTRGVRRE
jgi:hypothetical protein